MGKCCRREGGWLQINIYIQYWPISIATLGWNGLFRHTVWSFIKYVTWFRCNIGNAGAFICISCYCAKEAMLYLSRQGIFIMQTLWLLARRSRRGWRHWNKWKVQWLHDLSWGIQVIAVIVTSRIYFEGKCGKVPIGKILVWPSKKRANSLTNLEINYSCIIPHNSDMMEGYGKIGIQPLVGIKPGSPL